MPSLSQRGILFLVICSVMTWQNSCQSTVCQFVGCAELAAGPLAVTTRPKQTPRKPPMSGMPKVRTAKSFWSPKIST